MLKKSLSIIIFLAFLFHNTQSNFTLSLTSTKQDTTNISVTDQTGFFIENKGQWRREILFAGDASFGKILFYRNKVEYLIMQDFQIKPDYDYLTNEKHLNEISMSLVTILYGEQRENQVNGSDFTGTLFNYFSGNDESIWGLGCRAFRKVVYKDLWNGIDLLYYFSADGLKYDILLSPEADEKQIQFSVFGASLEVQAQKVIFRTPLVTLSDSELYIYGQKTQQRYSGSFFKRDLNSFSFGSIPPSPRKEVLVIDPLIQSTFMFTSNRAEIRAMANDGNGDLYVAGIDYTGRAFVSHLSKGLKSIYQTTYVYGTSSWGGGGAYTHINALVIASNGDVYVAGLTSTTDFPKVLGGALPYNPGVELGWNPRNGFVSRLSADLSEIKQSTYFGGPQGEETIFAMDISPLDDIQIIGSTTSWQLPKVISVNDFGGGPNMNWNHVWGFVSSLSMDLTQINRTVHYGGWDGGTIFTHLAYHPDGMAVAAGYTASSVINCTENGAQATHGGNVRDSFLIIFPPDFSEIFQATYLGGSGYDTITSLDFSSDGHIFVSGATSSVDFPKTSGGFQSTNTFINCNFVSKLSSDLKTLYQSTYYGYGTQPEDLIRINSLQVAQNDSVYVGGFTNATTLPAIENAYQNLNPGGQSGFISKFSNDLTQVDQSTFLGTSAEDSIYLLFVSSSHQLYVAGETKSDSFPGIQGGALETSSGDINGFVSLFSLHLTATDPPDDPDPPTIDEYPILLVHGIQLAPYNPLTIWESLAKALTGQSQLSVEVITVDEDRNHYVLKIKRASEDYRTVYISDYDHLLLSPNDAINSIRIPSMNDIRIYAKYLKHEIDAVKQDANNAEKVNIISHSMGGLISRTYIEESAFDSDYAKSVYSLYPGGSRFGLPEYENDVNQLIMLATPNHGSPLGDMSFLSGLVQLLYKDFLLRMQEFNPEIPVRIEDLFNLGNNCAAQMQVNSNFMKVLNYKKDQKFDLAYNDLLASNVIYNIVGSIIPRYIDCQLSKLQFWNKKAYKQCLEKYDNDLKKALKVDENRSDLSGYGDGIVSGNSVRLYSDNNLRINLNKMFIHADHFQIPNQEKSYELVDALLKNPAIHIETANHWKPYGVNEGAGIIAKVCSAVVYSPVVLKMSSGDEMVGASSENGIQNNTKSAFLDIEHKQIFWINPSSDIFTYRLEGYKEGVYGVQLTSVDFENEASEPKLFDVFGQATNDQQVDFYHIDWNTQEVVLEKDLDGDGTIDVVKRAPGTPQTLTGSLNYDAVRLEWKGSTSGSSKIKGYQIFRTNTNSNEFIPIAFISAQHTIPNSKIATNRNSESDYGFTDSSGLLGQSYAYYVTAVDEESFPSTASNFVEIGPLTLPPAPHLRIWAELNKPTFSKDETAMVMVTVMNQGKATATNTRVKMTLPQELSFLRASRYRSVALTPSLIEFELGAIAPNSVQTFQVDVKVLVAVSQLRSIPIHFDVNCTEKSFDFAHVLLQLIPLRSGRPDLYLGLYYRNASWDPQTASVYIPQDTPLEIDFVLTGAQTPYEVNIDWGDGEVVLLTQQTDLRQTLRHQFKSKGKMTITVKVTDQLQRSKTATISMEVR